MIISVKNFVACNGDMAFKDKKSESVYRYNHRKDTIEKSTADSFHTKGHATDWQPTNYNLANIEVG